MMLSKYSDSFSAPFETRYINVYSFMKTKPRGIVKFCLSGIYVESKYQEIIKFKRSQWMLTPCRQSKVYKQMFILAKCCVATPCVDVRGARCLKHPV